ncbi:MAG TPA: hypothetical protein VF815_47395 [Myxococcaceae bacterium]|jgi:hypothetical protein
MPASLLTRINAALLSALLVSCSAVRHLAPTSAEDLTRFVLLIQELPDGSVTHVWQHAEEVDLARYRPLSAASRTVRRVEPVAAWRRDCDEENRECIRRCMNRPLPRGYGHMTSGRKYGGKEKFCTEECLQPYRDCVELERLHPQEFTAIEPAVDWLKRNYKLVLVGSVVVIAGVAFVVVSAVAGVVLLAPAVLLAAPAAQAEPLMAKVEP